MSTYCIQCGEALIETDRGCLPCFLATFNMQIQTKDYKHYPPDYEWQGLEAPYHIVGQPWHDSGSFGLLATANNELDAYRIARFYREQGGKAKVVPNTPENDDQRNQAIQSWLSKEIDSEEAIERIVT